MRMMSKVVLAGAAAMSLTGAAVAADHAIQGRQPAPAASADAGRLIAFVPADAPMPVAMTDPMDDPMFADVQRAMAAMDARMDAMMRAAATMPTGDGDAAGAPGMVVSINGMPAGSVSYSFVSSSIGANGCTQTVEMTSDGRSAQPKVVRTSAGDCGTEAPDTSAAARTVSDPSPAKPAPAPKPDRRGNI